MTGAGGRLTDRARDSDRYRFLRWAEGGVDRSVVVCRPCSNSSTVLALPIVDMVAHDQWHAARETAAGEWDSPTAGEKP